MHANLLGRQRRSLRLAAVGLLFLLFFSGGCGSAKIQLDYPGEILEFNQGGAHIPTLFIDKIVDMRPIQQRTGTGHFFSITYPKDKAWSEPVEKVYGEALAQDLAQTQLVELVPFPGQAEFILSVDLLSLTSQLQRSPRNLLLTTVAGASLGMVLGEDASGRFKAGLLASILAAAAIPLPTQHHAEAEARMTLRDNSGKIVWQEACYGEYNGRKSMAPIAREDQELVDRFLTKAIKRANGCLLGQLQNAFLKYEEDHPASVQP